MLAMRSWSSGVTCVAVVLAGAFLAVAAAPALAQDPQPNLFTTIGITTQETRGNSGIRGPYSLPAEEMPPSRTVGPGPSDTADDVPLRMPDTSGNLPNLAAFGGQTLTLPPDDRKAYTRIHFFGTTADGSGGGDFLLTYADGSTQSVPVSFPDWCQSGHWAIGPLSKRWTPTGQDGAPCGIFHVPAEIDEAKTLVSVKLPPGTVGGPPEVAYLMALTLEQPDGAFELPDLSGREPCADEQVAPVTAHRFSPAEPNASGWYAGPVQVALDATDEEGGSGVEQVMYRLDGGAVKPYGGEFTLDIDGPHTLEYRAIDCAGNAEDFKSVSFKLDAHAPSTSARTNPRQPLGPDDWYDGAVDVTLTARDGLGSQPLGTAYRLDGGPLTVYDKDRGLTVATAGRHVLEYGSADVAGNVEAAQVLHLNVDATPPETRALLNGGAPVPAYVGGVRVAFARSDGEGSGAASTAYRVDGGAWTPYTDAFDVTATGAHRVDFRSSDVVGNTEAYRTVEFTVSAPTGALGGPLRPAPFAALAPVARNRASVGALRRGRMVVRVTCQGVERGTLTLAVDRATARRLGLGSRVLARAAVRCGEEGRAAVRLRPGRKVRRALARSRRAVEAGLTLRMAGAAPDEATLVLKRG